MVELGYNTAYMELPSINVSLALADNATNVSVYSQAGGHNITNNNVKPIFEAVKFCLSGVINPALCIFGVVGNIFNVIVLTRRRMKKTIDCSMERAAHLGLIALAVSDIMYCACAFHEAFISTQQVLFKQHSYLMYVRMYGKGLTNVFLHTSTWLTVIMAAGRYAAICRPLQARYLVGVNATRIAVVMTFIVWVLLELPLFWAMKAMEIPCQGPNMQDDIGATCVLLDHGPYNSNPHLKMGFSLTWFVVGFFIPVTLLAYCNFHLIKALRESTRMRQLYRVHQRSQNYGSHITPTLVAIVCMFIILVSPSEILHLIRDTVHSEGAEIFLVIIHVTNVLQTMNFAFNFVLYCLVNVHFRETWKEIMYCTALRRHYSRVERRPPSIHSNATKGSFLAQSSFETVI